jgi:DNA-binding transcriptional LysR family regulator
MTPLPTIRQMQSFAALAEHRSFSRAAEICNVSQSSLSAAIRALEDAVEAQLVDRSGRVVTLTEAGEAVLELAAEPLLLLEDGHCLRQHVLSVAGSAPPGAAEVRATSLTTLVQRAVNRLGPTLMPRIAVDAGIAAGTNLAVVPVDGAGASRDLGLAWRRRSRRAADVRQLVAHLRGFVQGRQGNGGRAGPSGEAPPPAASRADGARLARGAVPACVLPVPPPLPSLGRA